MSNELMVLTASKIADVTGFKAEEVSIIKNTVAKGTTDTELAYFLSVCKSVTLNPFMKEIWCYKDSKGNVLVFAGRDGFLKRAQQDKRWNGMTSFEVCMNDEFEINVPEAKVKHNPAFKDRGAIIGAYAIIKPKDCDMPTVEWAELSVYNKGYNVWKSDPASMIKKVVETHALKKAFGISGLSSEYDFEIKDGVALSLDEQAPILPENKDIIDLPEELKIVISESDKENLLNIYNTNKEYHSNPVFMQLLNKRKLEINGNSIK